MRSMRNVYLVGLAEDDLVVAEAEGVPVERHRVQVNVRVGSLGLARAGAVKVPDWQLWKWMRQTEETLWTSLEQNEKHLRHLVTSVTFW